MTSSLLDSSRIVAASMAKPAPMAKTSLSSALDAAHSAFTTRNPNSLSAYNEARSHFPGANTRTVLHTSPFPLTFARGQSCYLDSVDGDSYIDFLGEYTAGIYGHSCHLIKQAVKDSLDGGWNFGGANLNEKKLAAIVVKRFNKSIEMVRFCNSGTEANLMAVGAAINYTGRKKILVFSNAYHGSVFAFPDPPSKDTMNVPFEFVLAPYNSIPATTSILKTLPTFCIAAILVEPMQGAGGCIPGTPAFLSFLRNTATSLGALLIFDEVMTSRLAYGGYQTHPDINIKPDLTTIGKWVGGGMSFGAYGGRRDIMAMFDPVTGKLSHSGTFNNNVVSMAAGIVGCGILTEEVIVKLNRGGDMMRKAIEDVIKGLLEGAEMNGTNRRAPRIKVTGIGSLMNITFTGTEKDTLQGLFYHHMLAHGIYLAARGFVALSIEINEEHITKFRNLVKDFVQKWRESLV